MYVHMFMFHFKRVRNITSFYGCSRHLSVHFAACSMVQWEPTKSALITNYAKRIYFWAPSSNERSRLSWEPSHFYPTTYKPDRKLFYTNYVEVEITHFIWGKLFVATNNVIQRMLKRIFLIFEYLQKEVSITSKQQETCIFLIHAHPLTNYNRSDYVCSEITWRNILLLLLVFLGGDYLR